MIAFRADPATVRMIEENRGDLSASQFIRRAIRFRLEELDREDRMMKKRYIRCREWLDEYLDGTEPFDFTTADIVHWISEKYNPYALGSSNQFSKLLLGHEKVTKVGMIHGRTVWRYVGVREE